MENAGPLANLAQTVTKGFGAAAGAVVMVVMGWQFLKVILSGGIERALVGVGRTLLVLGIAVAALGNLPAVGGVVLAVGKAVVEAAVTALQSAL